MSRCSFDPKGLTPNDLNDAVKRALGNYPEDIMEQMRGASDALDWLSGIFGAICVEARSGRGDALSLRAILRWASCGKYLADDSSDVAGVWREEMTDSMDAAGIEHGGKS